jgi:RNA polymerase sporulation-specific sigma factor
VTRQKNTPSGGVISLSEVDISVNTSLEDRIISAEGTEIIFDFLQNQLSPLELSVIKHHLSGVSYKEIAERLDITEKAVDNAVQRTRSKLGRFLDKE